jgi:mRNA-degrading endonuclease HigB of HigAB toxin-antitoxin module
MATVRTLSHFNGEKSQHKGFFQILKSTKELQFVGQTIGGIFFMNVFQNKQSSYRCKWSVMFISPESYRVVSFMVYDILGQPFFN